MAEIMMIRDDKGRLVCADSDASEALSSVRTGETVSVTIKRSRNLAFHRKAFALFKLAFDMWDAPELEYKGEKIAKNFDRFRKDITILAGHYTASVNVRGEVRLDAKSLSFSSMDGVEFAAVYDSILSTVWDRVLRNAGYTSESEINKAVEELLRF